MWSEICFDGFHHPCHELSMSGSLYSSMSFFWPTSLWTVSSCTIFSSKSQVHLHLWWKRKTGSFRFSCAVAGLLTTWISDDIINLNDILVSENMQWSGLLRPCSWTNILPALRLIPSCIYIPYSHDVIILGTCGVGAHCNSHICLSAWCIALKSHLKKAPWLHLVHWSLLFPLWWLTKCLDLMPLVCSLLQLCHAHCLHVFLGVNCWF